MVRVHHSVGPLRLHNNTITIYGNENQPVEDVEISRRPNGDIPLVDQFVQVFSSNSLGIPFDKFRLGAFGTTDGAGKEFLKICRETIKDIDFNHGESRSKVYFIEDLSEVLKSSPKLQFLSLPTHMSSKSGDVVKLFPENSKPTLPYLMILNHYPEERKKCCRTFVRELLEVAPNISNIRIFDHSNGIEGSDSSVEDILTGIDMLGRESSIESLSITSVTKEHIEMMQRMAEKRNGLKLKELELHGKDDFDEELNPVRVQLVTFFKNSLEDLDVRDTVFNSLIQFPTMPHLESLRIAVSEDFNSRGIDSNKIFPTLKNLTLSYLPDDGQTFDEFLSESEPCLTLKSFEFTSIYVPLNSFNQILNVFPNLTKLGVDIKEPDGIEILKRIWTQMTQLESLEISFKVPMVEIESLYPVFTGIPFQTLQGIRHVVNSQSLGEMTSELRRETISNVKDQHCQLPSIGNLTNLKFLDLFVGMEGDGNGTDLTDLTAYLSLHSMPRLKQLNFNGTKITDTCLDILKADMRLESLAWM